MDGVSPGAGLDVAFGPGHAGERSEPSDCPFYRGDAYLIDGRELDETDQDEGRRVCMISRHFARNNGLAVGDPLPLSLILASCFGTTSSDASYLYWPDYGLLNAEGKAYEPFFEAEYTVVGIYDRWPDTSYSAVTTTATIKQTSQSKTRFLYRLDSEC